MNTNFMQGGDFTFGEVKQFNIVWNTRIKFRLLPSSKPGTKENAIIAEKTKQNKTSPLRKRALAPT